MLARTTRFLQESQFAGSVILVAQNAPATVFMKAFAPSVQSTEEANSAKTSAARINMRTKILEPANNATTNAKSVKDPVRTIVTTAKTSKFSSIKFHSIESTTQRQSSIALHNASRLSSIKFSPTQMKARTGLTAPVFPTVQSTEALKCLTSLSQHL